MCFHESGVVHNCRVRAICPSDITSRFSDEYELCRCRDWGRFGFGSVRLVCLGSKEFLWECSHQGRFGQRSWRAVEIMMLVSKGKSGRCRNRTKLARISTMWRLVVDFIQAEWNSEDWLTCTIRDDGTVFLQDQGIGSKQIAASFHRIRELPEE